MPGIWRFQSITRRCWRQNLSSETKKSSRGLFGGGNAFDICNVCSIQTPLLLSRWSSAYPLYGSDERPQRRPRGMSPFTIMCHPLVCLCLSSHSVWQRHRVCADLIRASTYQTYTKHIGSSQRSDCCHLAAAGIVSAPDRFCGCSQNKTGAEEPDLCSQYAPFQPQSSSDGIHF